METPPDLQKDDNVPSLPPQDNNQQQQEQQQEEPQYYSSPTGLRILCLHDANSSASSLKTALTKLGDRLYQKHGIDLVYINSPLCANTSRGDTDRLWYEAHKRQGPATSEDGTELNDQMVGLDASLCLLQQIWASMPFWGILGIGQGAAIGSLLSLLPDVKPRAKFGIFVQGEALIQEAEQLVDDWPCLHIVDNDNSASGKLIQQFGGAVHSMSRDEIYSKKVMNVLGKVSKAYANDFHVSSATHGSLDCFPISTVHH